MRPLSPLAQSDTIAKLIREFKEEVERIKRVIAALEQLRDLPSSLATNQKSRRGRKRMDPEERKQVSVRMKAYWAARRQKR